MAGLQILDVGELARIVCGEGMVGLPLTPDQRVADEQFSRLTLIDAAELHLPVGDQADAEDGDGLVGDRGTQLLAPPRVGVRPAYQV